MTIGILGTKVGMTQVFDDSGFAIPVTVIKAIAQKITVDSFQIGQNINISGNTIGKGFAGTVKRYNFSRGPMTHGSKNHREPGSIGQGSTPGRVHKGKKMGGRLGGKKTTIKNLEVIYINSKDNLLVVRGSVPGKSGNLLSIR